MILHFDKVIEECSNPKLQRSQAKKLGEDGRELAWKLLNSHLQANYPTHIQTAQNGGSFVSIGVNQKLSVLKREEGIMHQIASEFLSLGEVHKETGWISFYNLTVQALFIHGGEIYDLLKHPKEIQDKERVEITQDRFGNLAIDGAIEFEVSEESQIAYQISQALTKNVDSYSYLLSVDGGQSPQSIKLWSHICVIVNFYMQEGDSIYRSTVKYLELASSEGMPLQTNPDFDPLNFDKEDLLNFDGIFQPAMSPRQVDSDMFTLNLKMVNSLG